MRKFIISALVAGAAIAATPASAQPWSFSPAQSRQVSMEINQLQNQIQRAQQRRAISVREATGLRRQVTQLQRQHMQFARNGLNRQEVRLLQSGVNRIRQTLRLERRDFDNRRG